MNLLPRESAQLVMSMADHVKLDPIGIDNLSKKLKDSVRLEEYDLSKWKSDNPLHPQSMNEESAEWIFVIDSLNFSFWPDQDQEFTIDNEIGYWALCAAIKRARCENIPIIDPNYYSQISLEEARHVFRTDQQNVIPMLKERVSILNENGRILKERFNCSFVNCIRECDSSAINLLGLVYKNFPSFRDESSYKNHKVTFMKRAQILIADIWACFEGKGLGHFNDIDQLTMFADYRIPQVLHYFGVIKYSKELEDRLKHNHLLENGHPFEVEIRAASIYSIELIRDKLVEKIRKDQTSGGDKSVPNSIQLDYYLWGYRRANADLIDQQSPFHRVRCIYY